MSAKKVFETKINEDENTDSGFLSGPLSGQLQEDDYPAPDPESDVRDVKKDDKVLSGVSEEVVDLDSGLDLYMSGCLDGLQVDDATPTPLPTFKVTDEGSDIPPLAILFQQDEDGDTQLHIAAVHGCEKSVGTLIRVCPDKYLLDLPNDFGHTALHLAVMSSQAVITRMLVRAGAGIGVRDLNGDTPVHLATATRQVECLQALLAPIEGHSSRKLAPVLNQKNYEGQACIHLAATSGHKATLQTLLYYGADINAREGLAGWTALHIAARRGDARLAATLLQWAGVAAGARDFAGRTPRRLARRLARAPPGPDALRLLAALPEDDSDDDTESEDEDEAPPKRSRVELVGSERSGADTGRGVGRARARSGAAGPSRDA